MSTEIAIALLLAFNRTVKFWKTLRKIAIPLFVLTVVGTTLDQLITIKMENLLMSPEGTSPLVWAYGALSLLLSLTYPLLGILLVISTLQADSLPVFLKKHFRFSLIEEMRSWGQAMMWSFLLLIPGLIRFLQFLLVPFIVCLDPAYQRGERDALVRARELVRGRTLLWMLLLFPIFSIIVPVFLTAFDEWKLIWKTPLSALLICLIEMLVNFCFIWILWKIYRGRTEHESHISMERH
jgi:hypothetical protein